MMEGHVNLSITYILENDDELDENLESSGLHRMVCSVSRYEPKRLSLATSLIKGVCNSNVENLRQRIPQECWNFTPEV